jgi:predicted RNA-binding Zn-ribbon protein involved in translation (DUF1610 family)
MHECPRCESKDIHRSRAKSKWEHWRKEVTGKRPYRCKTCGWRGWGVDLGPKFDDSELKLAALAIAPEAPNLKDTALARDQQRAEMRLEELDSFGKLDDEQK